MKQFQSRNFRALPGGVASKHIARSSGLLSMVPIPVFSRFCELCKKGFLSMVFFGGYWPNGSVSHVYFLVRCVWRVLWYLKLVVLSFDLAARDDPGNPRKEKKRIEVLFACNA